MITYFVIHDIIPLSRSCYSYKTVTKSIFEKKKKKEKKNDLANTHLNAAVSQLALLGKLYF